MKGLALILIGTEVSQTTQYCFAVLLKVSARRTSGELHHLLLSGEGFSEQEVCGRGPRSIQPVAQLKSPRAVRIGKSVYLYLNVLDGEVCCRHIIPPKVGGLWEKVVLESFGRLHVIAAVQQPLIPTGSVGLQQPPLIFSSLSFSTS